MGDSRAGPALFPCCTGVLGSLDTSNPVWVPATGLCPLLPHCLKQTADPWPESWAPARSLFIRGVSEEWCPLAPGHLSVYMSMCVSIQKWNTEITYINTSNYKKNKRLRKDRVTGDKHRNGWTDTPKYRVNARARLFSGKNRVMQ